MKAEAGGPGDALPLREGLALPCGRVLVGGLGAGQGSASAHKTGSSPLQTATAPRAQLTLLPSSIDRLSSPKAASSILCTAKMLLGVETLLPRSRTPLPGHHLFGGNFWLHRLSGCQQSACMGDGQRTRSWARAEMSQLPGRCRSSRVRRVTLSKAVLHRAEAWNALVRGHSACGSCWGAAMGLYSAAAGAISARLRHSLSRWSLASWPWQHAGRD